MSGRADSGAQAQGSGRATDSILVKNLPPSVNADLLELFFESKRKQGGGPVKHVSLDKENHVAVIEFEEPEGKLSKAIIFISFYSSLSRVRAAERLEKSSQP